MSSARQCSSKTCEHIMNPNYCNCHEVDKAVEYTDIRYYRPEDDSYILNLKRGHNTSEDLPN